jgi:fructosamine-3-kinase
METLNNKPAIEELVHDIIQRDLGFEIESIKNINSGAIGQVFSISVKHQQQQLVVKLGEDEKEYSFDPEPNDNRVYGVKWSNLQPSHDLLTSNHIAVPTLHSIGRIKGQNLHYVIMDLAEGESIREYLAKEDAQDVDRLHAVVGEVFGRMHSITRDFQGWIDMNNPYPKSWKEAFFESFDSHLLKAADKNQFIKDNLEILKSFSRQKQDVWIEPDKFVFSHTDGFQGVAKHENNHWQFTGVVDVEDNQFTDQRFVLTGYELALNQPASKSFWNEYKKYTSTPDSYQSHKNLFKMYYLLSWLPGYYNNDRFSLEDKVREIKNIEQAIGKIW